MKNKVPANKRPDIQVSEQAVKKGMYAVELTERQFNRDNTKFNDNVFVQYFSVRDFQQFIGPKGLTRAYAKVEIVHDPTIKEKPKRGEQNQNN